jgi:tetraacyldisaccharide 4'-kinase
MLDERALREIWYGGRAPGLSLRLLASLFGIASGLRRRLYGWKILPRVRLRVPVIVVGNITVGGTGKTPLVIALVAALRERGRKPGVVSRGYAGASRRVTRVDAESDPAMVGDEAKLIFESAGVPVMVGRDRAAAGQALIESAGVNVIIADDGLQHYRLMRNVEICVIDGTRRFGNGNLLPAGPLREKVDRLDHVDFRVCNGDSAQNGEVPMHLVVDRAIALRDTTLDKALSDFAGQRVHAVAGIGNPSRFFASLRTLGMDVIEHPFPDHHAFVPADLDFDDNAPTMMTDKDAVKCRKFARDNVWRVPVRTELPPSFFDQVHQSLNRNR